MMKAYTAGVALGALLIIHGGAQAQTQRSVPVPCPEGPASGLGAQMNPIPCLNNAPPPTLPSRNESSGVTSGAPIAPGPPGDVGTKSNALQPGVYSGKGRPPQTGKNPDTGVYSRSGMR